MVACAHPDDAELNCGGTLLHYHKPGHNVFIVLTTSGCQASSFADKKRSGLETAILT